MKSYIQYIIIHSKIFDWVTPESIALDSLMAIINDIVFKSVQYSMPEFQVIDTTVLIELN